MTRGGRNSGTKNGQPAKNQQTPSQAPNDSTCTGTKRKDRNPSDSGASPPLKRQSSLPDLFGKSSVTVNDMSTTIEDSIIKTISKPEVLDIIAKAISENLKTWQSKFEKHIDTRLNSLQEDNRQLQRLLGSKQTEIDTLKRDLEIERNKAKESSVTLRKEIANSHDELEAYGRRNALRFSKVSEADIKTAGGTDKFVVNFVKSNLGINIMEKDISRSHISSKVYNGKCQIICKFVTYNLRRLILKGRSALKGRSPVFIFEDLTRRRQRTVQQLLKHRRSKAIDSVWSIDGVIHYKVDKTDDAILVKYVEDLPEWLQKEP